MKDYQAAAKAVYDYYCRVFGRKPGQYELTPARRRKIITRLKEGYSVTDIQKAIKNLRASAWHVENGYIGLDTFLLKSRERLDDWIARTPRRHRDPGHYPPPGKSSVGACPQQGGGQASALRKIKQYLAELSAQELEQKLRQIEAELNQKHPITHTWKPETLRDTAYAILRERVEEEILSP